MESHITNIPPATMWTLLTGPSSGGSSRRTSRCHAAVDPRARPRTGLLPRDRERRLRLGQFVLADLIGGHAYDRHVRASRLRYRRRRDLLVETLRERVPHVRVRGVAAGLHALVLLPDDGPGEDEIVHRAEALGLALMPLRDHWQNPAGRPQGLIAGYSTPQGSAYPAALDALCTALA
ncbi:MULTISPECIES: hypothetical protein [unclassified Spirillospora]|uniref:hypothetical protein n=1 Tax=unclassified Spirillospora TaxID=2642701 RepID=UPI00371F234F